LRGYTILHLVGMADRAPLEAGKADAAVNRRIELLILTGAQAAGVTAMFGTPGPTESLADEVKVVKPGDSATRELRSQLAK
jgi:chemotaxis protein MotB